MLRKKEYFNLFLAVVLFVGLFCVFTCNPLSGDAIEPLQYKYLFLQLGITIYSFSLILITLYGANIIRDLKTKQQRIDELVLPATNLEKFTARVLASTVLILIIIVAGIMVADVLQMLINMLLHKGTFASFCLSSFNVAFTELQTSILAIENVLHKPIRFMFLLTLISGNAFYLLGGMLFRKTAWLKTTLAVIVISIALFSMFVGYAYVVYGYTNYVVYTPEWMQDSWFNITLLIVQTCACYYFAYRIYCRLQAINTRWLNI
jgi:putative membrane protein